MGGGIFKTKGVAQKVLASALNIPVAMMKTAGEGGAWGIALLAEFLEISERRIYLAQYLENEVFSETTVDVVEPDEIMKQG